MRYLIFRLAIFVLAVFVLATAGLIPGLRAVVVPAAGQEIPKSLRDGGPDDVLMQRKNGWTVTIAAGNRGDAAMRFADELGRALNDGDDLRVLPVSSHGPASNLEDLLRLPDIDLAVTQSDVLEYFRTERKAPIPADRIRYITRLPAAELHVTARNDIHTLEDLRGHKVVFGAPGSAAALTGPIVFRRLGIPVKAVFVDSAEGIKLVRSGEAAALVGVDSKPGDLWSRIPPYAGLHLLPAPFTKVFADLYVGGEFTSADYPNLIGPGEQIETIAVPSVLAVQNVPKSGDRFRRVLRFVQYLTARWDRLNDPPFYPGWRGVSLAATVPGWTRFSASEVFRQFILWREQQQHKSSGLAEGRNPPAAIK
jgi:TRAP-type uncharacterized transport system substrate-binding protein